MSRVVDSSSGRRQMAELLGEETGLPIVICLKCSRARVCEARSQKENLNIGRVYMKCPVSELSFNLVFVLSDL
jgi:hypothetical protein